jgi:hypothetical protein
MPQARHRDAVCTPAWRRRDRHNGIESESQGFRCSPWSRPVESDRCAANERSHCS